MISYGNTLKPGAAVHIPQRDQGEVGGAAAHVANQDQLAGLYARCDAWLFSTRVDSFGLPILEAMRASLPVVASNLGAMRELGESAARLVEQYEPDEVSIERVFMHRNADSALKLGQARAAALCGTFTRAVPVHEYAAREVKQTVTGSGGAEKSQVAHMVRMQLPGAQIDSPDAADALAAAQA